MATGTSNPKFREDDKSKQQQAPEKAKESFDKAKEVGGQAMDKAKEVGGQVMDKAKEAASSVGEMAGQAFSAAGKKADDLTSTAGADIKKWGDAMSEKSPHDGILGHASQAVAETIKEGGKYLQEAKLSGMADDVSKLIQKHPVPAIMIGIGVGFILGRALRD